LLDFIERATELARSLISWLVGCLTAYKHKKGQFVPSILSVTYKYLKTGQPSYLRSLLSFPSHRCTRSSSLITLSRPSPTSRLKIANSSFYNYAPVVWNNLPSHLRQVVKKEVNFEIYIADRKATTCI